MKKLLLLALLATGCTSLTHNDNPDVWDLAASMTGTFSSITLIHKGPGTYQGSTSGKGCESNLGEAAYTTSEVTLSPGIITSWDRGWTTQNTQAWGAEKGPYIFKLMD